MKRSVVRAVFLAATLCLSGSTKADDIVNGDFENALNGWTVEGQVSGTSDPGANDVAFFEEDPLGAVSKIYQVFNLPPAPNKLTFSYVLDWSVDGRGAPDGPPAPKLQDDDADMAPADQDRPRYRQLIGPPGDPERGFPNDSFSAFLLDPVTLERLLPPPGEPPLFFDDFFYADNTGLIDFNSDYVTLSDPDPFGVRIVELDVSSLPGGREVHLEFGLAGGPDGFTTVAAVDDVAVDQSILAIGPDAGVRGSLLIFSKVELRWDVAGNLLQDTLLELTNDADEGTYVQMYFVNGDAPLDAVVVGDPPVEIERAHPGWNWVDAQVWLTQNQPTYWSAVTGLPLGVQPWPSALDPGDPPGRPDPAVAGERMLRGFVYAWAVDAEGFEIAHNYLSGQAMIVNHASTTAFEYDAWSFGALNIVPDGVLNLDGLEYWLGPERLLLDFYAIGAELSSGGDAVTVEDTDLTFHPVSADLRQEGVPLTTKAKADIWNMNEFRLSGTERCITCWDQTLASNWMNGGAGNNWLLTNLQTNKGKARIDGVAHAPCEAQALPILGVAAKVLDFGTGIGFAGSNLILLGTEPTTIEWDVIDPPDGLMGLQEGTDYSVVPARPTFAPVKQLKSRR